MNAVPREYEQFEKAVIRPTSRLLTLPVVKSTVLCVIDYVQKKKKMPCNLIINKLSNIF